MSDTDDSANKLVQVTARRVMLEIKPPRAAQMFSFAHIGDQFLFEVGYVDLFNLGQLGRAGAKGVEVEWYVSDQFVLDSASVERLCEIADQLKKELEKQKKEVATHAE